MKETIVALVLAIFTILGSAVVIMNAPVRPAVHSIVGGA